MDEIDRGNETAEKTLAGYIGQIRARAQHQLVPTGVCYNCEETLGTDQVFCGPDCRADFDHRETVRRRTLG